MSRNHDLAKVHMQHAFHSNFSARRIKQSTKNFQEQGDVDRFLLQLDKRDAERRMHRVYDRATLAAGSRLQVTGLFVFVLAALLLGYLVQRDSETLGWMPYITAFAALAGGWAAFAGWRIRTAPNLPYTLQGADIESASQFLDDAGVPYRRSVSPLVRQLVGIVLTADAALIISQALPAMVDWTANQLMLAVVILAPFVAYILNKLITGIAKARMSLEIRKKHSRLFARTDSAQATMRAEKMRHIFGDTIVEKWDPLVIEDYLPTIAWWSFALIAIACVTAFRWFASSHSADATSILVTGILAVAFFVASALLERYTAIEKIAECERILDRFPNREAFEREMIAMNHRFDAEVLRITDALKASYRALHAVRTPDVPRAPDLNFTAARVAPSTSNVAALSGRGQGGTS